MMKIYIIISPFLERISQSFQVAWCNKVRTLGWDTLIELFDIFTCYICVINHEFINSEQMIPNLEGVDIMGYTVSTLFEPHSWIKPHPLEIMLKCDFYAFFMWQSEVKNWFWKIEPRGSNNVSTVHLADHLPTGQLTK